MTAKKAPTISPTGNKTGFTLIEIVFVMAVLGILLAASMPRFAETTERLRTERTAFELVQHLRYAREQAVTLGTRVKWVWHEDDPPHAELRTIEMGDGAPTEDALSGRWATSAPVPEGIDVTLKRDGQDVDAVVFSPDGTSEGITLTVSHRKVFYTITVHAATGQVLLVQGIPAS